MALDTLSAPDNLSRVLWLPSLVFSLDPPSFLRVQQASRAQRDEKNSVVAAWYWRRMILLQLPESGRLSVVKEALAEATEAAVWRRVFLDFDTSFVNAGLMSTDTEYLNFYTSKNKSGAGAPPDLTFANLPANSCQLQPNRSLGGDRIVVGSRPFPKAVSCTSSRHEKEWRLGYRVVQGYFEVEIGPSSVDDQMQQFRQPCVSVGVCTSDIQPKAVMSKQVGWCRQSWGLHSDDGNIYHATGIGTPLRPYDLEDLIRNVRKPNESKSDAAIFGVGDVIGCGIIALPSRASEGSSGHNRGVFYTKNGSFLGIAFLVGDPDRALYPCAGIDAHWKVLFNFGTRPYAFDVDSLGQILVRHRPSAIPTSASAAEFLAVTKSSLATSESGIETPLWPTAPKAALEVIRRAAKSLAWMRRRGRNLVFPFVEAQQRD